MRGPLPLRPSPGEVSSGNVTDVKGASRNLERNFSGVCRLLFWKKGMIDGSHVEPFGGTTMLRMKNNV